MGPEEVKTCSVAEDSNELLLGLERGLGVLPSAPMTISAASGLTIQGRQSISIVNQDYLGPIKNRKQI